ncbi:MAG: ABC transporter ATP-binding protein [Candidatus Hodarchaeota archaeon]
MKNGIMIDIQDIKKHFDDVKAVDGISLQIKKGELFGLLGPNGAGKTTMINMLCGLLDPTGGEATIDGLSIKKKMGQIKKLIGVCPQQPAIFPYLTGSENVEFFGDLHAMNKKEIKSRSEMLLEKLSLIEHANRKVQKYSGGMVRRISIAMALVHNPEIAFLDEPTVAMDPQSRRAVWEFIKDLKRQDKTVILTTHYIEEAEALSDRVGIIDNGKLIELGPPAELNAKHDCENLEDVFLKLTGRKIREAV